MAIFAASLQDPIYDSIELAYGVIDNLETGIIVVDDEFKVIGWNHWMSQHSRIPRENAVNKKLSDVFRIEHIPRLKFAIQSCILEGRSSFISGVISPHGLALYPLSQFVNIESNVEIIRQSFVVKPVRYSNSRRCLIQIMDVSQTLKREQTLRDQAHKANQARIVAEEASKVKSEFTSMVSHELRTPLTAIHGSLKLMASGKIGSIAESMQSMLDISIRNTNRLLSLINDLLDMQKLASGKMSYFKDSCELLEIVQESIKAIEHYGSEFRVSFKMGMDENAVVFADKQRLLQVMANLLSNAAKFSYPNSDIIVSSRLAGAEIIVSVQDSGRGIDEKFKNKVFESFTQSDSVNTRLVGGTGLGLNISKSIVEHHGGKIWFESELDKGSTFFFSLPILTGFL